MRAAVDTARYRFCCNQYPLGDTTLPRPGALLFADPRISVSGL